MPWAHLPRRAGGSLAQSFEAGQQGLLNFSSQYHDLRPSSFWRRFGSNFWLFIRASSLFSSECHGPTDATVLRTPVSSESLFSPPAKDLTRLLNALPLGQIGFKSGALMVLHALLRQLFYYRFRAFFLMKFLSVLFFTLFTTMMKWFWKMCECVCVSVCGRREREYRLGRRCRCNNSCPVRLSHNLSQCPSYFTPAFSNTNSGLQAEKITRVSTFMIYDFTVRKILKLIFQMVFL